MTLNATKIIDKQNNLNSPIESLSLIEKYEIDFINFPILSNNEFKISLSEKVLIIEKLLEAHELAKINVELGNITGRGFATNVCTMDNIWALGTNFNNTRNDISSICGERSAIITAYNQALLDKLKNKKDKFEFKIKYLCMAQSIELNEIITSAIPCEDCLSWLNTNRYFDDDTLIFSFERNQDNILSLRITNLSELLPYKNMLTSNLYETNKKIEYTKKAINSIQKKCISEEQIKNLLKSSYQSYLENNFANTSAQNVACSILTNEEIFSSKKIDWTKRWHVEPLENVVCKAIEKFGTNVEILAISYFGDEKTIDGNFDGVVSIKSLGRIRQKYANNDTLLILNLPDKILVTTIGGYLPKKFVQGYKIV